MCAADSVTVCYKLVEAEVNFDVCCNWGYISLECVGR